MPYGPPRTLLANLLRALQRRPRVGDYRLQHVYARVQVLAEAAEEADDAADEEELARDARNRVRADRLRHALVRLGDEVWVGVRAALLADLGEAAAELEKDRGVAGVLDLDAQVEEGPHHVGDVPGEHRVDQAGIAEAELVVELPAEAEVQHDQLGPGLHEQISWMRVRVEHAVQVELLAVGVDDELRDGLRIDPLSLETGEVCDLDAFEVLHHQHTAGAVLPDDLRHDDVVAGTEVPGDQLRVVALVDEVQLQRHVVGDLLDQRGEVEVALEARQDAKEEADVSQVVLHDALDAREGLRGHLVREPQQDGDIPVRDEVRPRADDLPEFDEQPLPPDRQVVQVAGGGGVMPRPPLGRVLDA